MGKKLKVFLSIVACIIVFFVVVNIMPGKKAIDNNPFIATDEQEVLVAAHRGGAGVNPENTMLAFERAVFDYKVDILELDLCLTLDGQLIANHNETLDEVCDVPYENYVVAEHTLDEISHLNFAYNFEDLNGEYPYRYIVEDNFVSYEDRPYFLGQNKISVCIIDEIFGRFYSYNIKYIIELKDGGEIGKLAADKLLNEIHYWGLEDQVIVSSFNSEIEDYVKELDSNVLTGASLSTAALFVVSEMLKFNPLINVPFMALQIPTSFDLTDNISIKLNKKSYINRAHRRNISVQFWTINDVDEMRELIDLGADVIMTDRPDLLYNLLKDEYKCRD